MVALIEGTKAPDFKLITSAGSAYSLQEELKNRALVLLAFFKVTCPVVQLEFPYLERLHRSYPAFPIWGISQDDADATNSFAKMYGVTFPLLLDDRLDNTVKYDLNIVPTLFLVGNDMVIKQTIVGFAKAELEKLNTEIATSLGLSVIPLFTSADEVPAVRPGCESKRPG
ncbi:MAG TPA: redoxin domain-containing protein [Candidatus Melainabacteria bacterium]|nr:redoxin domain-containing protein [Candidatus Melainabacteria bacterium]